MMSTWSCSGWLGIPAPQWGAAAVDVQAILIDRQHLEKIVPHPGEVVKCVDVPTRWLLTVPTYCYLR